MKQLIDGLCTEIDSRAKNSPADKDKIKAEEKEIQSTATKALQNDERVDESFLLRRFRDIARMALHVLNVVVATFGNPSARLGVAVKK